jgi:alginate O-acetyltransferase complex protein AlgI
MVVMGLWHEVSLRFLIWGLYQGLGIVIWQYFQKLKPFLPSLPATLMPFFVILSNLLTLHYVMMGMIIAENSLAETLAQWKLILLFWL